MHYIHNYVIFMTIIIQYIHFIITTPYCQPPIKSYILLGVRVFGLRVYIFFMFILTQPCIIFD